jgi:hypothetical protein
LNALLRLPLTLATALLLSAAAVPGAILAASPVFGTPTATSPLGEDVTFTSQISGDDIVGVDVLVRLVGFDVNIVLTATPGGQADTWQVTQPLDIPTSVGCSCVFEGNSSPNTDFEFQFRVRASDGTLTLGPIAQGRVEDTRFAWRTMDRDLVSVHWYAGDDAFARTAADLANDAIDRAAELLGTTLPAPVDLFVYDTQQALLEAVSPNRENIAGEAHHDIRTMFVWLEGDLGVDGFAAEVVRHELTHLVFDAATRNPYHGPPLWLNEGIAVYLSAGYSAADRGAVEGAAATGALIPLDGIAAYFPAPPDQFFLAYAEAVSAVDFFVRTYGEPDLWDLVRSYAQGMTDDAAFSAATGADVDAFNSAWFESLGATVPEPLGPQPGPTGPVPPDWAPGGATPGPTLAPGQTPATPRPTATPRPGQQPGAVDDGLMRVVTLTLWVIVIALVLAVVGFLLYQRNRDRNRRPPSGWQ